MKKFISLLKKGAKSYMITYAKLVPSGTIPLGI